jgi:hypothetical protein
MDNRIHYKDHLNHLMGDEVSGRGFGYECLWRCRLMLSLGWSDTLSVYTGEDARIYSTSKKDGLVYYQVKYTSRQWTPKALEDFLLRVTKTLARDPNSAYVFCTNVSQTRTLKEKFAEINSKYRKSLGGGKHKDRLRYEIWVLDDEDPTDKIQNGIRSALRKLFHPRKFEIVLPDNEVQTCRDKLLSLEARFKLTEGASITGKDVFEQAGLSDLASKIPSLILGDRLFTWHGWAAFAEKGNGDPTLASTRLSANGISLDLENQIFELSIEWIRTAINSKLYLILGASGVGKTWSLLRLGSRLSSFAPVYWADELSTGQYPELSSLSAWEDQPTILLADNIIEAEWGRMLPAALRSKPPLLVIGTTAKSRHNQDVIWLTDKVGQKCELFNLGPVLTETELKLLVDLLRDGTISNDEEKRIQATNIRRVVERLSGQPSEKDLTARLVSIWHTDDCQPWVMPLLLASSLGIKIPQSVLRHHANRKRYSRREFPDELWPLVLRVKREKEDEEEIWLEDVDLARHVLYTIEQAIGKTQLDDMLIKETEELSQSIRPLLSTHRRFARRIIREFSARYPAHRVTLLDKWKTTVMALLPLETKHAIAYSWLSYLPHMERQMEARKAAQAFVMNGLNSVADVILIIEAFGDEQAKRAVEAQLQGLHTWKTEPWASFIELLRPLDVYTQKELLSLAIPVLQHAPLDFEKLMDTRTIATDLTTLLKDHGRPEHREWMLTMLNRILPVPSNEKSLKRSFLLESYLPLVDRCIRQARSQKVLWTMNELSTAFRGEVQIDELYGRTYDLYKAHYQEEQQRGYAVDAWNRAVHYLASEPSLNRAHNLWIISLDFASNWSNSAELSQIEEAAYEFLRTVSEQGLSPLFETLFLACGRDLIYRANATPLRLTTLLSFLEQAPATPAFEQLAILIAGAVAKSKLPQFATLITKAKVLLRTICTVGGVQATQLSDEFLALLANILNVGHPKRLPIGASAFLSKRVVADLMTCISNVEWNDEEQKELAMATFKRWGTEACGDRFSGILLNALFHLQAKQELKDAISDLLRRDSNDPDALLFQASWEARFGSSRLSQARIADALNAYLNRGQGGHPPQIRRAYLDLARRSLSPKREILELCAALQQDGRLRPIQEVLKSIQH